MKFSVYFLLLISCTAWANPFIIRHNFSDTYLKIEVLENRGLHFELIQSRPAADRIWTSPMIDQNPALSQMSNQEGTVIRSQDFIVKVNQDNLCTSVKDLHQDWDFITTCPHNINQAWKGLALFTNDALNAYGLGAYYQYPGTSDGDWIGRVWDPTSHTLGNALRGFSGGAQSYAMFPVLYVQGSGLRNYMLLYDSVYKQMWSLNSTPWRIEGFGDQIRWYIFTDKDVKKLRQKFMQLTGRPMVPPKASFGVWLSEFGYDNWDEAFEEVDSMHNKSMPVDGIALDLQWFGGSFYMGDVDRSGSRFGTLSFDEHNFPNPKQTIEHLRNQRGVEVMTIEESYISQWLGEFHDLQNRGFMARDCHNMSTTILTHNPWWGIGGMIDWTNPDAGLYWHNVKRQKLYELGISYHWTDLGEPEMYSEGSCYFGFPELKKHRHGDIHNIYNLKWIESIARGYQFNKNQRRPFMLSRSGTIGIQKHGAAMWSGDIGANMGAMTAHYNTQMHMSYSGVDFFGSDIGGFHRRPDTLDGDPWELYTQWFANAALFDFPVRGHTWNLSNQLETSPSKIGDFNSNQYNIETRYTLSPYYYSLAHLAHTQGLPVIAPMAMEFPQDLNVRKMGNQKMIGPFLMAAMSARYGETQRNVYFPQGKWMDYHNGREFQSQGQEFFGIKTNENGIFRLPLFLREGAILPLLTAKENRSNISGLLYNGERNLDLTVAVYPAKGNNSFTLFEDDGVTVDYLKGAVATTELTQQTNGKQLQVKISATQGSYQAMPESRDFRIAVFTHNNPVRVNFNGNQLGECQSSQIDCYQKQGHKLTVYLGQQSLRQDKLVSIQF